LQHIKLEATEVATGVEVEVVNVAGPCRLESLHIRVRYKGFFVRIYFDGKEYFNNSFELWQGIAGDGASYRAGKMIEYDDATSRYTIHFTPQLFARDKIIVKLFNPNMISNWYDAVRAVVSVFRIPE
ncbi:unnamed protein product, partial [marine sediment metagenome]